jgi:hypothetical protein
MTTNGEPQGDERLQDLDDKRLAAVLEGRDDPAYDPSDYPLIEEYDDGDPEKGADH